MKVQKFVLLIAMILSASILINAQTKGKNAEDKAVKSSPAYAEVLLRQVSVRAELEDLLVAYTDEYPKVKELRIEDDYLKQEMKRLLDVKSVNASGLSSAVGKLIVEKVSLEMDLWNLIQIYDGEHLDVKRARRKVKIFEDAIKEIL